MVRRTARPKLLQDDAPLPEGFTRHDGGPCPIPGDTMPAVFFRSGGTHIGGEREAEYWDGFAEGSCWEWRGQKPEYLDILGYRLP